VSKPDKTPLTFYAADWVELTEAFLRIMSFTRRRDLAQDCFNRDLRSGKLKSALVKISPEGGVTMTLASAYAHTPALGLLVEVAAVTGARFSQLAHSRSATCKPIGPTRAS
jgi:hypothetical protein